MVYNKDESYDIFCHNVSALRKRHCLSKKKMARILGIGIASLDKIERGVIPKRMSCDVLIRLGKYFDISFCDLLAERQEKF